MMSRGIGTGAVAICAALFLMLVASSVVRGADSKDPKIVSISGVVDQGTILDVLFDNPYPSESDVGSKEYWIVFAKDKKGRVTRYEVKSVDASAFKPNSKDEKKVVLELTLALPTDTAAVDITVVNTKFIIHTSVTDIFAVGAPTKGPFKACSGKSDCDIYVTGSYTASIGGSPLYAIDSFGGYMRSVSEEKNYGKLGFYGQIQEKSASTVNPDSFLGYLDYQRVLGSGAWFGPGSFKPFQAPIFNYRFVGTEFNKTGDNLNFVTSPVVTFPIRLSGKLSDPIKQGITFPILTIALGTEFVDVKRSVLARTGAWHVRGLMGATFAGGIPFKKSFLYSIQLTSSYQLRLPSADEIYYDSKFAPINPTTGKAGAIPPHVGTQPRHYVNNKVTYNLVRWFGVTFEHSFGSLPPSFVKTNQTFAVGLTFSLAEASFGRYSILKP
jgi:hypothetical protein